jgi:hypothetical protein
MIFNFSLAKTVLLFVVSVCVCVCVCVVFVLFFLLFFVGLFCMEGGLLFFS